MLPSWGLEKSGFILWCPVSFIELKFSESHGGSVLKGGELRWASGGLEIITKLMKTASRRKSEGGLAQNQLDLQGLYIFCVCPKS